MRWNPTDERYHEALRRLAVVLLVLAEVAERAAGRSWPVRSLVLWLLGRAEARVRGFAERAGALPLFSVGYPVCLSGGSGEAGRLASSFRALAASFFALARKTPQWLGMARRHDPVSLPGNRRNAARPSRRCGARQPAYADTS
jgi:hypothetical protein